MKKIIIWLLKLRIYLLKQRIEEVEETASYYYQMSAKEDDENISAKWWNRAPSTYDLECRMHGLKKKLERRISEK